MNADGDWNREGGPWYQLNGHNPAGLLEVLRRLGPEGRKRLADQQVDGRRYDKPRLDLALYLAMSNRPDAAQLTALDAKRNIDIGVVRALTPLLKNPAATAADAIARLPVGGQVEVTGRAGDFFHVKAGKTPGYVAAADLAIKDSGVDPAAAVPLDKTNWLQVIPDAMALPGEPKKTIPGNRDAQGPLVWFGDVAGTPTTSYHQQDGHDLVTAVPTLPNVTDENITQLVKQIADARAAIPLRDDLRVEDNKDANHLGYAGGHATESYTTWHHLATTKPTQSTSTSDMRWRVLRRMEDWEGSPAAVQTWDQANVTYGVGFAASGGQFEQLMNNAFKRSSDITSAFAAAGLAMVGGEVVVVDPVKRWKLHGPDALLYLRSNTALLSLMKNVAEDVLPPGITAAPDRPDPRQAILDANFETFLHNAMAGIPVAELGKDVELAALKVHAIHGEPGHFSWNAMKGMTTIAEVISFIRASADGPDNITNGFHP